jgi:cytochrome c peroxidase
MLRRRDLAIPLCALSLFACDPGAADGAGSGSKAPPETKPETDAPGAKGIAERPKSEWDWALPAGLMDPPPVPPDNPMTEAKVDLGHLLFMDKRLSGDGSRSCYSCHQNELGNADGRKTALGAGDKPLTRNTPTIWNVAYQPALYWDGRAPTLEKQGLGAWKGGNMGVGADNLEAKAAEIGKVEEYASKFQAVFGLGPDDPVLPIHVTQALSAYERTLLCGDSAYDTGKLDDPQKRGADLFKGKASCSTCHAGDTLSDGLFHNVGIGFDAAGKPGDDIGHGKPAKSEAENYKFRTPTLRNVTKTGPYFHDGSVASLEDAVRTMASGSNRKAPGIDENLVDRKLSDAEIADIVAFLGALECTGSLDVVGDQTVAGIPE